MDKKTATLYDSLGILPTATDDEIRRAYRKIALQYHPDKNRTADPQTFQGVARSYGILSDSKKKAVYDRYGEFGVSMLGTVAGYGRGRLRVFISRDNTNRFGCLGRKTIFIYIEGRTFFDPEVRDMVCCLVMGFAVLVLLTLLFLLAVVLRIDGIITWTWSVVFLPVWAVLAGMFVLVAAEITIFDAGNDEDEDDDDMEEAETEAEANLASEGRLATRAAREVRQEETARSRRIHCTYSVLYFFLFLSVAILIVLRLDNAARIPLFAALSPYFTTEVLTALGKFAATAQEVRKGRSAAGSEATSYRGAPTGVTRRKLTAAEKLCVVVDTFWWWTIRVSFAFLLALRCDELIDSSWSLVFLPLYFVFFWHLWKIFSVYRRVRSVDSAEARRQAWQFLAISLVLLAGAGVAAALSIELVVRKLEASPGSSPPATLIAAPLFAVLGLLFLAGCCLPPLLLYRGPTQKFNVEDGASPPPLPPPGLGGRASSADPSAAKGVVLGGRGRVSAAALDERRKVPVGVVGSAPPRRAALGGSRDSARSCDAKGKRRSKSARSTSQPAT